MGVLSCGSEWNSRAVHQAGQPVAWSVHPAGRIGMGVHDMSLIYGSADT